MSAVPANISTQKHTIKRWAHDRQNPYTQIHNELIRDETVAPEARLLLIYLLANKDGWEIRIAQLINHFKPFWGRDKVYKVINQCIKAGYMQREVLREAGKHIGVNYYVAEYPAFKEFIPLPEITDAEIPDEVNTHYNKEQDYQERPSVKESSSKPSSTQKDHNKLEPPLIDDVSDGDDQIKPFSSSDGETDSSDIVVTRTNGKELRVTQSQVYMFFLQHPKYTTAEIQEAIKRFRLIQGPINNVLKYLVTICETIKKEQLRPSRKFSKTKTLRPDYSNFPPPEPNKNLVNMGELMARLEKERLEKLKKDKQE